MPFHFCEGREGACGTRGGTGCEVGKERAGGGISGLVGTRRNLYFFEVILCNILHKKKC